MKLKTWLVVHSRHGASVRAASGPGASGDAVDARGPDGPFKYTNRLVHEQSPYLLQHAHNLVDWYPWGPVAGGRLDAILTLTITPGWHINSDTPSDPSPIPTRQRGDGTRCRRVLSAGE